MTTVKLVVGWGTFKGKSERHAKTIAAACGVTATPLKDVDIGSLSATDVLVAVLSTQGNGQYTKDAESFIKGLEAATVSLSNLRIAILGLGSKQYKKYCQAAVDLQANLTKLGAKELVPFATSDMKTPDQGAGSVSDFTAAVLKELTKLGVKVKSSLSFAIGDPAEIPVVAPRGYGVFPVTKKEFLSEPGYAPQLWRFSFDYQAFKCGDHALVLPRNQPERVAEILTRYGLDPKSKVTVDDPASSTLLPKELSIEELLSQYVSLADKVPASLEKFGSFPDVGALLAAAPAPLPELLPELPPMEPRTYSIASAANPLELIIAEVFNGEARRMSSWFWHRSDVGAPIALKTVEGLFKYPEGKNIILVGLGSGIAALMSIIKERASRAEKKRCVLYYGERYFASAHVLCDQIRSISDLEAFFAISREGPREHINDVMIKDAKLLLDVWNENAELFYCGNLTGFDSIKKTVVQILTEAGRAGDVEKVKQWCEAY